MKRLIGFIAVLALSALFVTPVAVASERKGAERAAKGRKRGQERLSEFLRKGISGERRTIFTERDREIFKAAAGDLLIELGYESDHSR